VDLDIDALHRRLLDEGARLRAELAEEAIETPEPMTYGSQAAAASQVFDQNRQQALRERAQRELVQVDAALARLVARTYGRCQSCGKPIDPARLEALPWAQFDLDCQRRQRG
jgi:DnaK suppressor protein